MGRRLEILSWKQSDTSLECKHLADSVQGACCELRAADTGVLLEARLCDRDCRKTDYWGARSHKDVRRKPLASPARSRLPRQTASFSATICSEPALRVERDRRPVLYFRHHHGR